MRPRPGHRAVAMFPGTELQDSCFHRGEKEKEASNDQGAGSKNRRLSALAQLWTQGQASASQLVTGAARRVHSQAGSTHYAKLEMQQNATHERRGPRRSSCASPARFRCGKAMRRWKTQALHEAPGTEEALDCSANRSQVEGLPEGHPTAVRRLLIV